MNLSGFHKIPQSLDSGDKQRRSSDRKETSAEPGEDPCEEKKDCCGGEGATEPGRVGDRGELVGEIKSCHFGPKTY